MLRTETDHSFPSPGRQPAACMLLTQWRVFRVASSRAARPSASVLSLDEASRSFVVVAGFRLFAHLNMLVSFSPHV